LRIKVQTQELMKRDIIVIGASAGGADAIRQLISELPPDLDASIFIVWHMSPDVRGILPHILHKTGHFEAAHAVNRETIRKKRIYVAPPDHHLLIEKDKVRVTRGPKENRFRPAVDPLFRSAALAYGPKVIGIILSGALDDGASGLWAIKQQGGLAVVQDPSDAEVPSMPVNAIQAVKADYIVPVARMGDLLVKLIREQVPEYRQKKTSDWERADMEVRTALEDESLKQNIFEYGEPTPYTCPECHGVLAALQEDGRTRFRCHTGHAFSADTLLAAITESIEEALWNAIRNVQENILLLNHMGDHFAEANQPKIAAVYFKKAEEARRRADLIRQAVFDHEQFNTDNLYNQAKS